MTSAVHDLSDLLDKNKSDEQQRQSKPDIQHHPSTSEIIQPGSGMPSADYMLPHNPLGIGHVMAQTAYPVISPFYGGFVAAYGGQTIHPPMTTLLHPGMPFPTDTVEEPVYVNAKQYYGILRRRQSRAKAESENKLVKSRKPYLHESRHQHALKRARGHGGRFVNSKAQGSQQSDVSDSQEKPQTFGGSSLPNPRPSSGDQEH